MYIVYIAVAFIKILIVVFLKNGGGRVPHLGCKSVDVLKSLLVLSSPDLETFAHFKVVSLLRSALYQHVKLHYFHAFFHHELLPIMLSQFCHTILNTKLFFSSQICKSVFGSDVSEVELISGLLLVSL